jgi:hypothetical protein
MSTLAIRIPQAKHSRLRSRAEERGMSVNKLADELFTIVLTQHDTEARFRALANRGSRKRLTQLLEKLARGFAKR